jgi:hypothetical protein
MNDSVDSGFAERVRSIVAQIPSGRVMTYGQIAAICGNARAARIVGGIAHFSDPAFRGRGWLIKKVGWRLGIPAGEMGTSNTLNRKGL